NAEGGLDSGAELAEHTQKLVCRISERDQGAAVVEQHAVGAGHPHILMPVAKRLTHLDEKGAARMVDVADKTATVREATAECMVRMEAETVQAVREGTAKGDALQVARIAGIMAAKRTADLIPLCHPLPLTSVDVALSVRDGAIEIVAAAETTAQTGVEMEALTAASVAALTVYDMAKAVDKTMRFEVELVE